MNKCPHCESNLSAVNIDVINGNVKGHQPYRCISYTCPHCSRVLSVQMDPLAVQTDTLDGVESLLQKHLKP
jgi:transposase-like protein